MPIVKTIQWKALLLLIIFAANFSVVCHCSAHAMPMAPSRMSDCCDKQLRHEDQHSCCGDHQQAASKGPDQRASHHHPCDDKGGCPATHALKFNLLEKQVPVSFHPEPLFAALVTNHFIVPVSAALPSRSRECQYLHKHSPPDLQALYQRFLI